MLKTLLDTQLAHTAGLKGQVQQVVKFLATNRNVVIPHGQLVQVFSQRPTMATGTNRLFERLVETKFLDEFATVLPIVTKGEPRLNLPDLLGWTNITIDLKGNHDAHVLDAYYELKNKILANVAELIKVEPGRGASVSDINELHSMYVRGMFVRSYAVQDGWLTPQLAVYLIQSYCLPIATVIARMENLNAQEMQTIAMLFALYMSQRLARRDEDPAMPDLYKRCTFLGTHRELDDIAKRAASTSNNILSLATTCELCAEFGPERMNKFNVGKFYRSCSSLGPTTEIMSTQLAFEYPPYWLSLILRALDGYRAGAITSQLKQHKLIGRDGQAFIGGLLTCRQLFENR